jgi:hypothetical protein
MKIRHAFTGYVYELVGDGLVQVTDPATGREGLFDAAGRWREGELTYADLHMCGAVGGRKAADPIGARRVRPAPPTTDA